MRVALAQLNPVVGDLDGNVERILAAYDRAEAAGCDLVAFAQLSVCGAPPGDLVRRTGFLKDVRYAMRRVAKHSRDCVAVVGYLDMSGVSAAAVCRAGEVLAEPVAGGVALDVVVAGSDGDQLAAVDIDSGAEPGAGDARLTVVLGAEPFIAGARATYERALCEVAERGARPLVWVNQVGGQDELVYDGASCAIDATGRVVARAASFVEELVVVDLDTAPGTTAAAAASEPGGARPPITPIPDADAGLYDALVLATRDYVRKNGFSDVVIGLSGGLDSSLVAALAADALGAEHVHGVLMPSRYTSQTSVDDADALAAALGIETRTISVEPAFGAYLDMLSDSFAGLPVDLTEENLQSRVRGTTLMALSNKFNWLVLTTGNKSEVAVGYFTLYGDSAGGFAPIKDVFKTRAFELARYVNTRHAREVIPDSVLTKPPTAELRADQRDDQSLPPYDVLDPILACYVEEDLGVSDVLARGHDARIVLRVLRLVDVMEHKRRQGPPGPRVSPRSFGSDRRVPVTNGYRWR